MSSLSGATGVRESLRELASAIHAIDLESPVYLGGSCLLGKDDEVSDVDLWVTSERVQPEALGGLLVAGTTIPFGEARLFHGMDHRGTIVDLMLGPKPWDHYQAIEDLGQAPSFEALPLIQGLSSEFWINSYKHRKPLYRGVGPMVCFGLHFDRMFLLRAWVREDTGEDPGPGCFTIHGLTGVIAGHVCGNREREELLGLPARNSAEIVAALVAYRREMIRLEGGLNQLSRIVMVDPVFERFL